MSERYCVEDLGTQSEQVQPAYWLSLEGSKGGAAEQFAT